MPRYRRNLNFVQSFPLRIQFRNPIDIHIYLLLPQPRIILCLQCNHHCEIRPLSRYLDHHAPSSCTKPVLGMLSYGCYHFNQHRCWPCVPEGRGRRKSFRLFPLVYMVDYRSPLIYLRIYYGSRHVSTQSVSPFKSFSNHLYRKTKQDHALSRMTAVWLLPVVTLIVASSSGGILAPVIYNFSARHALITLAVSTCMVSIGLTLAFMILTMYLLRLLVYGLPPGASVLSVFIPLGPMGQGGYSILLLGQGYKRMFPLPYGSSDVLTATRTGEIINVVCVCAAIVLWSLASMWLAYALLALAEVLPSNRFPFKLPFWGLIFPNVNTQSSVSLAVSLTTHL